MYVGLVYRIMRNVEIFLVVPDLYHLLGGLGTSPLPLTSDYAGSTVRYADGIFDPHFGHYITVMEGE